MSGRETRLPPGGFADRLEAELVKVVAARAALSLRPRQRAAAAMRRTTVRAGALAAGTVVAAAASLVVGGPLLSHGPGTPPKTAASAVAPARISPAAFTVGTYSDGTVHVSWDKSRYIQFSRETAALQEALRKAGFPVLIKEGVFCRGPHDNGYLDPSGVGPGVGPVMRGEEQPGGNVVFIFTPAAMPRGKELFIGYLSPSQLAVTQGQPGSVERLVPTGAPLTCTTQAPLRHSRPSQPATGASHE